LVCFDKKIGGLGEEGSVLDVVIADEPEDVALRVDSGVVIDRAVAEAKREVGGYAVAASDLDEVTVSED
jgi:hypothetical protein